MAKKAVQPKVKEQAPAQEQEQGKTVKLSSKKVLHNAHTRKIKTRKNG